MIRKGNDNTKVIKKTAIAEKGTGTQQNRVACPCCGKTHVGVCYLESGACFRCKKVGHVIRDCPTMKMEQAIKPIDGKPRLKIQGQVFVVTKKEAEASNTVVTGTLHLFSHDVKVLVDPGSTHFFMSSRLMTHIDATPELLKYELVISTPLGKTMVAELVYKSCVIRIREVELLADLILLDL